METNLLCGNEKGQNEKMKNYEVTKSAKNQQTKKI
jgi:hypothetical protein